MKRYALFCFMKYYPEGGWNDFLGCFEDVESAVHSANNWEGEYYTWDHERWSSASYHVIDLFTGEIVKGSDDDG